MAKTPTTTTLSSEQYWKFRAQESDRQRIQERAETALVSIRAARRDAILQLGLDPEKEYTFNDDTCTIEEGRREQEQGQPGPRPV